MRNAEHTALLLALLVKRSGERRVRVSDKTIKLLAGRQRLRSAFVVSVMEQLSAYHGLCMIELDIGGFGIVHFKSLEAAKAATVKRLFHEDERQLLREGNPLEWDHVWSELGYSVDGDEGEEAVES